MSWSLEGLNVSAVYLDQFPISGTVALSRVQYGGQVCHTIILDTPLVVYGSLRDRVIIDHSQVNRVRDNNSVNQALQQLAEDNAQEIIDSDYHLKVKQLIAGQPEYIETRWD